MPKIEQKQSHHKLVQQYTHVICPTYVSKREPLFNYEDAIVKRGNTYSHKTFKEQGKANVNNK